jgi:hypothetical protein
MSLQAIFDPMVKAYFEKKYGGGGGNGGGGIGAVKFIDVDITVDASTATAVTYTVDDLEFISSVENPATWNAFSNNDAYIFFITPKEITGTPTGNNANVYNRTMTIAIGHTDYTLSHNVLSSGKSDVSIQSYGIYNPSLMCTAITNGKPTGNMTVKVRHNSAGAYEVVAGTYNIQVWYLTDWDWGHTS